MYIFRIDFNQQYLRVLYNESNKISSSGSKIQYNVDNQKITVPNDPMIPFITGDGIGIDITPVMIKVIDAAVTKVYGESKINWFEVYAGENASPMEMIIGYQMKHVRLLMNTKLLLGPLLHLLVEVCAQLM